MQLCDENEFTSLQIEIDAALERDLKKNRKRKLLGGPLDEYDESTETEKFIGESTIDVIQEVLTVDADGVPIPKAEGSVKLEKTRPAIVMPPILGLKPDLLALCTVSEKEHAQISMHKNAPEVVDDLNLEGLDDDEIDGYILTESEAILKDRLWNKMNAEYLKMAKEREERAAREREEGKPEKKKRRARKKPIGPSSNALDAIQKVLQEKKISSKINYDILKSLTAPNPDAEAEVKTKQEEVETKPVIEDLMLSRPGTSRKVHFNMSNNRRSKAPPIGFQMASHADDEAKEQATDTGTENNSLNSELLLKIIFPTETEAEDAMDDAADDTAPVEEEPDRLGDILNHREEDEYSGAEEYF